MNCALADIRESALTMDFRVRKQNRKQLRIEGQRPDKTEFNRKSVFCGIS